MDSVERAREYLVLASYCGDDNPKCTNRRPCGDCLAMCNVFRIEASAEDMAFERELGPLPVSDTRDLGIQEERAHPLARMVAMDEEMEAKHPGWMTGEALLSCPCCGSPAVVSRTEIGWYAVDCGNDDNIDGCGLNTIRTTEAAAIAAWNRRTPTIERDTVDGEARAMTAATFTIEVREDGATSMHTKAVGKVPPFLVIDHAIKAILAERAEMRGCSAHKYAPPEKPCPFCGERLTYPDLNFQGQAWTTCTNRNCGANAPQEIWNQRTDIGALREALEEAERRLKLTQGCLDCNANDERFWVAVISFLKEVGKC